MITLHTNQACTSRVMQALAMAFEAEWHPEAKRCNLWGKQIGNAWKPSNKQLVAEILPLINAGLGASNGEEILLTATDYRGFSMFKRVK